MLGKAETVLVSMRKSTIMRLYHSSGLGDSGRVGC